MKSSDAKLLLFAALGSAKHGVFAVLRVVFDLQIHGGEATGAKAKSDAGADRRELVRIRKLSGFSLGSCSLEKMLNN